MSFRILHDGLHCSEVMLWWHPLLPGHRGCFCENGSVIRARAGNCNALHFFTLWMSHPKGWEKPWWFLSSRNVSSVYVACICGAYFKVEHLFTKLKVTLDFVLVIEAISVYYIKRQIEVKSQDGN